jgi:hypothetical protein
MTEIDFPDADADSCNDQWASICTGYEKSLSILATKKRDLEIRNDELVRINASLNVNYKVLKATISELSAEKKELVNHNKKLQQSLDYLREISGCRDLVQRQKQNLDERICAESWDRNRIFDGRVPVQKGDVYATIATPVNAQTEKSDCDERKHDTSSLGLRCDCGTTFKVFGDNLTSIKVKHGTGTSTTKSCACKCQNRRAKHKRAKTRTNTTLEAEDHNPSHSPLTPTDLRITKRSPDLPPGMDLVISLIFLGPILAVFCFVYGSAEIFG